MITITVLGETEACFPGSVVSLSGNVMHLYVQGEISVGGLLKVESGQAMYLGEVAGVWPQPDDGYTAVLMLVEHALLSRDQLIANPLQRSAA